MKCSRMVIKGLSVYAHTGGDILFTGKTFPEVMAWYRETAYGDSAKSSDIPEISDKSGTIAELSAKLEALTLRDQVRGNVVRTALQGLGERKNSKAYRQAVEALNGLLIESLG